MAIATEAVAQSAAQHPLSSHQRVLQRKLNESAVMVHAGHPGSSYFAMAHDIATVVGKSDDLRLITLDVAGGAENLRDLLLLRGVDLALVPANALADPSGSLGPDLPRRLTYITKLYSEETHILAGPGISSFDSLRLPWHPRWSEVNLTSPLAGWSRFATAEEWLAAAKQEQAASIQKNFEEFLNAKNIPASSAPSPKERKELLDEFVKWTRKSISSPNQAVQP